MVLVLHEHVCEHCGIKFETRKRIQKFCSRSCLSKNTIKKTENSLKNATGRKCIVCNGEIVGYGNKKYCSKQCRSVEIKERYKQELTCAHCGKVFENHKISKYCSPDCVKAAKRLAHAVEKTCLSCGEKFFVKNSRDKKYNVGYCSRSCYSKSARSTIETMLGLEVEKLVGSENVVYCYRPSFMNGKEIDIYLPKHNLGIEFNGLFWHSELGGGKGKTYHLDKSKLCFQNGIKLIHVFEDTWAEKRDIVMNRLKNILNVDQEVIYARNCSIREITSSESKAFLNLAHLQGNVNAQFRYGLFDSTEILVSVMTFGKNRKALGSKSIDDHYELLRYASSKIVVGGFSKLLKHFQKTVLPKKIISYMDLSWNVDIDNSVYSKSGFTFKGWGTPNYWYTQDYEYRENRFKFRKSELLKEGFDPSITESQIMIMKGYDKVFDCGSAKFEMIF